MKVEINLIVLYCIVCWKSTMLYCIELYLSLAKGIPKCNIIIIMAGMAVVLRGWLPHRGEAQMAYNTASPRGQCSK